MSFKENYKMEMNGIIHDRKLDDVILRGTARKNSFLVKRMYRFVPAAVAAAIALVIMVCNFETITVYATSLFGNFAVILGGKEAVMDEIEPVDLDYEHYSNDQKAEWNGANYYYNYEDFHEGLGMELPASNTFQYQTIMVHLVEGNKTGNISVNFLYENESFDMNGRFLISDFEHTGFGYGEMLKAYEVYEYTKGKKAYFVREAGEEYYQRVYFSTENYVFQLFVENSEAGVESAKEILEVIGNELKD